MNNNKYATKLWVGVGVVMIVALMVFGTLAVPAQDQAQIKEIFTRSQRQNEQALRQYTWKSRNEVKKNGESKNTQIFLMSYDIDGKVQKSQIGGSAPQSMPKGPILASIARKKKEEFIEQINSLRDQVEAYSHLPAEKIQTFLASATINARLDQGMVQIKGENVLQRGDSMSIWLDTTTRKQRRVEILTFLERNPVKAVIEFRDLPAGPTYMARTLVDYQKEALQLITENFDYERGGRY
jgi:hypothetical protein